MKIFTNRDEATSLFFSRAGKLGLLLLCVLIAGVSAHAQTFSVIHAFSGGGDGFNPSAGVTIDAGGNLYGTTTEFDLGTAFEMKRRDGVWILSTLNNVGPAPQARLVFGPGGALYSTVQTGGQGNCTEFGCGLVYSLRPPGTFCRTVSCRWDYSNTFEFDGANGNQPGFVDPTFDSAGNMYGTTSQGGIYSSGNVFQLTRANGIWTGTSLYDFNTADGSYPYSGVTLDAQGNAYGTTWLGGLYNDGTVYQLVHSGSGWTLNTLYTFQNSADGENPVGQVVFDQAGNLYGATQAGGAGGGGTVFELSPSGGGWNFTVLYSLVGQNDGPVGSVTLDAAGNIYGTTYADGAYGYGNVFKLTRGNGGWTYTSLHDFADGPDGANPVGGVTLDASGNMYGTAYYGGPTQCPQGCGVVWEITP
jgi:uncharacterized repeat protein (TIGR03803 family)